MRRIKCPACQTLVNDTLEACSRCGFPFRGDKNDLYVTIDNDDLVAAIELEECCVLDKNNSVVGDDSTINKIDSAVNDIDISINKNEEGGIQKQSAVEIEHIQDCRPTYFDMKSEQIKHKGALVRCPECGADAYSEDSMCMNCGFPVGKYFEEQNKETVIEMIDNLSVEGVKDYVDYVIHDARNTIKLIAVGIVIDGLAIIISLYIGISKICMLTNLMQQYSINKASYAAGNADATSMSIQYRGILARQSISVIITVALFIAFIIGFVTMYKKLKKDYEE